MKNDGTYFLVVQDSSDKIITYKPVLVYPFEWNGVELFVHRVYSSSFLDDTKFWQATVKSCGLSLELKGVPTISEAIRTATEILGEVGVEKVNNSIQKQIKVLAEAKILPLGV